MQQFEQVKAIMFDLDNTLIVRRRTLEKLAQYVTRFYFPEEPLRHELIEAQFCEAFISGYDRRRECFEQFRAQSGLPDTVCYDDFFEMWSFYYPYCTVREPSAKAVLELKRRGYDVSILTNGPSVMQNAKIDVAGIRDWFSTIVVTGEIGVEKPDPRAFWIACEKTGFSPEETAYVGDYDRNDIAGARSAGMPTIWFSAYMQWNDAIPRADAEIDSLWKLLDIFK